MRSALALSTRAKSSTCLLKQCYLELEQNKRLLFSTSAISVHSLKRYRSQLPPVLWFLTARSVSTQTMPAPKTNKEESTHSKSIVIVDSSGKDMTKKNRGIKNLHQKFHPRKMNKDMDLDDLLMFLCTSTLTPTEIFKSLRTALYNTTQYDVRKALLIYKSMVQFQVDHHLKHNNYNHLLNVLKYGNIHTIPYALKILDQSLYHQAIDADSSATSDQIAHARSHQISQVLFLLSRHGSVMEACDLIQKTTLSASRIKSLLPEDYPTANHYHSLAITLKTSKVRDPTTIERVASLMMDGMEKRNTILNGPTLSTIISLLPSQNQKGLTFDFLKEMDRVNQLLENKSDKHPYNVYIYTSLITTFARRGNTTSARRLFDEMKKQKIKPTQVTISALIEAYSKGGDFPAAIRLFTDYVRRTADLNKVMATSLLVNAIRHQNLLAAANTVKFIEEKKMETDTILRTAMLWFHAKKNVTRARKKYNDWFRKDPDLVNSIMVNHLVHAYSERGDKNKVLVSFRLNERLGELSEEEETRATHYLAHALFKCCDVPAAMEVFISMRKQKVPDDVTIAMVVQGLIMSNEENLAWRLFKTLQSEGVEPNLHAYTSILKVLGHRESAMKRTNTKKFDNQEKLAEAGIGSPNLDYLHSPVPCTTEALSLFRRLTGFYQPNVYTYTTLISCFAKYNITKAVNIFDHMCSNQVEPTVETYTALLQGCAIFRDDQAALTIFNHMCEKQIEPNHATWRYLLKSLLRSRVDKKKIDQIGEMARKALSKSSSSSSSDETKM